MALTYDESAMLTTETQFRGRVKVACLKYADSILNEASTTPAHSARLRWANRTFENPEIVAGQVQPPTVEDSAVQAAGLTTTAPVTSAIDDAGLQGAVESVVNKTL